MWSRLQVMGGADGLNLHLNDWTDFLAKINVIDNNSKFCKLKVNPTLSALARRLILCM
jgi:hypothetical protein